ncbi:hypothetical protein RZS08_01640, partial [Arthrospira platensis SPKY1]|nr:hypothetical protein [Arthrospira platensis SPKY1]
MDHACPPGRIHNAARIAVRMGGSGWAAFPDEYRRRSATRRPRVFLNRDCAGSIHRAQGQRPFPARGAFGDRHRRIVIGGE